MELLIVVAVVSIISAALIPSFGSFTRRQSFRDSAEEFADNVRLVRTKSHSGVVISGNPVQYVDWGINPSCGNSTYTLGYKNESGTWVSSGANTQSMTLSEGSTFDSSTCGGPVVFTRLKGTPDNQYTIKINGSGGSRDIVISSQGRVSIN